MALSQSAGLVWLTGAKAMILFALYQASEQVRDVGPLVLAVVVLQILLDQLVGGLPRLGLAAGGLALAMRRCWRPAKVQSPTGWPPFTCRVGSGPLPSIPHSVMPPDTSIG